MPASPVDDEEPRTDARSITDRVADQLRERIKYGRLAPGQRLVEADLIGQLHVSRSTIRAAYCSLRVMLKAQIR
jgi:DNA-binding GntR family transcriptional regulator